MCHSRSFLTAEKFGLGCLAYYHNICKSDKIDNFRSILVRIIIVILEKWVMEMLLLVSLQGGGHSDQSLIITSINSDRQNGQVSKIIRHMPVFQWFSLSALIPLTYFRQLEISKTDYGSVCICDNTHSMCSQSTSAASLLGLRHRSLQKK